MAIAKIIFIKLIHDNLMLYE